MALQQRKPAPEAAPPQRRTAIPAPANDNRARPLLLGIAGATIAVGALLYLAYRALS